MAASIDVKFQTTGGDANQGKIVIGLAVSVDEADSFDFYVGVESPLGEEIKAFPDAPDATIAPDNSEELTVDIPLDSDGNYLEGDYVFTFRRFSVETDTTVDDTVTYTFVPKNAPDNLTGILVLAASVNCLTGLLVAQDQTSYTGITILDRAIMITPPSIDTQDAATDDDDDVSLTVAYTNTTYDAQLDVSYSWGSDDTLADDVTFICEGSQTAYKEVTVTCESGGICETIECVSDALSKVYSQSCTAGGFARLPSPIKDDIEWRMMNLEMAKMHYDCGSVSNSQTFLSRAKEGLPCDCGCGGSSASSSTPIPFVPPAGEAAVTAADSASLTFFNNWDSDGSDAIIVKRRNGVAYTDGVFTVGDTDDVSFTQIAKLPAGFRPKKRLKFTAAAYGTGVYGSVMLDILTNGEVYMILTDSNAYEYVNFHATYLLP